MGSFSYTAFRIGIKSAVFSLLILLTQSACPNNPDPLECGENQIEVNGTCECAEGYHWNENQTQCNMDTTSHDFIWEIDTLGDYGSYLNDVAIIDENNIWVVGNIETDSGSFNAAHWDGSEWELISIAPPPYLYGTYYSVYAFNTKDVWFGSSIVVHFDGNSFTPYGSQEGFPGGFYINAIWGTSSSNLYFVGNNGSIVQYDGSEFTRMESGTDIHLKAITGTGTNNVWISGFNLTDGRTILLHYDGISLVKKFECYGTCGHFSNGITSRIKGIYADSPDSLLVLTQSGLYRWLDEEEEPGRWFGHSSNPNSTIEAFYGTAYNDIFYGGHFTRMWHFNGISFQYYQFPDMGTIYGIAAHENMIAIAGWMVATTHQAFVIRGYR